MRIRDQQRTQKGRVKWGWWNGDVEEASVASGGAVVVTRATIARVTPI